MSSFTHPPPHCFTTGENPPVSTEYDAREGAPNPKKIGTDREGAPNPKKIGTDREGPPIPKNRKTGRGPNPKKSEQTGRGPQSQKIGTGRGPQSQKIGTDASWKRKSLLSCRKSGTNSQVFTDVSGRPIDPIFKGQAVKDCLAFEYGTDRLSRNVAT